MRAILSLILLFAPCAVMAQASSVQYDRTDGTIYKPSNFFVSNGVPSGMTSQGLASLLTIGSTAIELSDWTILAALNQGLATTDTVTFAGGTINGPFAVSTTGAIGFTSSSNSDDFSVTMNGDGDIHLKAYGTSSNIEFEYDSDNDDVAENRFTVGLSGFDFIATASSPFSIDTYGNGDASRPDVDANFGTGSITIQHDDHNESENSVQLVLEADATEMFRVEYNTFEDGLTMDTTGKVTAHIGLEVGNSTYSPGTGDIALEDDILANGGGYFDDIIVCENGNIVTNGGYMLVPGGNGTKYAIGSSGQIFGYGGGYFGFGSNLAYASGAWTFENTIAHSGVGISFFSPLRTPGSLNRGGIFSRAGYSTVGNSFDLTTDMQTVLSYNCTTGHISFGEDGDSAQTQVFIGGDGGLSLLERSSDPGDPSEGIMHIWVSDGTGSGDAGDLMLKGRYGGITKTITLMDWSAN